MARINLGERRSIVRQGRNDAFVTERYSCVSFLLVLIFLGGWRIILAFYQLGRLGWGHWKAERLEVCYVIANGDCSSDCVLSCPLVKTCRNVTSYARLVLCFVVIRFYMTRLLLREHDD